MSNQDHFDEEELLRFVAKGAVDDGTRAIAKRLAEGDFALEQRHREATDIRDALALSRAAQPPSELVERTWAKMRSILRDRGPDDVDEAQYYVAEQVHRYAGVRSSVGSDINLVCTFGVYRLNAVLHGTDQPDRFALSGQLIEEEARPVVNLPVTLLVDRAVAESGHTDEFGEFEFGPHAGERFGIRVGEGATAASIELKGDSDW